MLKKIFISLSNRIFIILNTGQTWMFEYLSNMFDVLNPVWDMFDFCYTNKHFRWLWSSNRGHPSLVQSAEASLVICWYPCHPGRWPPATFFFNESSRCVLSCPWMIPLSYCWRYKLSNTWLENILKSYTHLEISVN